MKNDTTTGINDFADFQGVKMRQQPADDLITPSTQRRAMLKCETASVDESISVLTLAPRTHDLLSPRRAARWPEGRPHPELQVLDLLVDGISLIDKVLAQLPNFTLRSPLWIGYPLVPKHARALLGEGPSDLSREDPADHVALFMCPYCANGGCGVLSARLGRDGNRVHWTDIGRQIRGLRPLGPFTFAAEQYDQVLRPLLSAPVQDPTITPSPAA